MCILVVSGAVLEEKYWGGKPKRRRRRVASAEGGRIEESKASSWVEHGEGCPLPSRLGGLSGAEPGRKHIFAYFEGHRKLLLHLLKYVKQS